MHHWRIIAVLVFTLALLRFSPPAVAQAAESYKVRLAPVASDAQMKSVIAMRNWHRFINIF